MQDCKVNIVKKVFGSIVVTTFIFTLSLFGASPVKIMPLGDSITLGSDFSSAAANTSISYRGPLWTKLSAGGYTVDFVGGEIAGNNYLATDPTFDLDHEGHNGAYADGIASNVTDYLNLHQADIILLHIGTNDLWFDEGIASTVNDVNTTLENIDSVDTNIKVILARIINRITYDANTTIFNNDLSTMVQQRIANGDDIIIVDMETGADINYTTDMIDELHPNTTGYSKMADLWYSALSTVLTPIVPIHLWKLDEDPATSTYVDFYSRADGNCTDPGCPVPVAGQVNGAQSFDGNDKIDVTDTETFDWEVDANVTIEFWMKSDYPSTKSENEVIIGRNGKLNSTDVWYLGVDSTSGAVAYGLGNSIGEIAYKKGSLPVANGQWNHIAFIISIDKVTLYVNGELDFNHDREYPGTEHIQGTPVNIGYLDWTFNAANDQFEYIGQLDELTVYDTALSAALIQQHYMNGLKPHLAEVTTVPNPTNDTTPDYTFSSDKNGTISFGGLCDSTDIDVIEGNNTITFNVLSEGTYSDCKIIVTALDGNVSDPLAVSEFVVDTTTPTLAEVTPVPSPTDDDTPDYTFSSNETGTITYGGSCTSKTTDAVAGNNTITFDVLADGTYSDCTITVTDVASNASDPLAVSEFVVDTTKPVITLLGDNPQVIYVGSAYTELNATANDDVDGNISASIVIDASAVNTNMIGDYTVTYDVNDSSGNTAVQVTRTVNVIAVPDTTEPVITLLGNTPIDVSQGSVYTDAGATASDDVDGDITANIVMVNPVNTAILGQYVVTYDVNDSAGNDAAQVTRTVNVVDATIPIITLLGTNPQVIVVGDAYTELNATAQDDVDGDISANIVIDASAVDTSKDGSYIVTYNVSDTEGNAATEVTRTVNVTTPNKSSGGGCTYNPHSNNFDITFLLMIALGLFYPFRRKFLKESLI